MAAAKEYLGDGVYVTTRGHQIVLTTEDGIRATNTIYLEPEVYDALVAWHARAKPEEGPGVDAATFLDGFDELSAEMRRQGVELHVSDFAEPEESSEREEVLEEAAALCDRAAGMLRDSRQKAGDTATYLARDIRALKAT